MNCPSRFRLNLLPGFQPSAPTTPCVEDAVNRLPSLPRYQFQMPTGVERIGDFRLASPFRAPMRDLFRVPENIQSNPFSSPVTQPNLRAESSRVELPHSETPAWADLMIGILNLMSSADIRLRVPTNVTVDREGNIINRDASCRYGEFISVFQCDPGFRSSCFDANSYTDVYIPVRSTLESNEAIIYDVIFNFNRSARILAGGTPPFDNLPLIPGNAVAINTRGFRAVPPFRAGGDMAQTVNRIMLNPYGNTYFENHPPIALGQRVNRPAYDYYDLQYFFENGQPNVREFLMRDLQASRGRNALEGDQLSETFLNFRIPLESGGAISAPLDRLVGTFANNNPGSLIRGFIESFGLNHPSLYPPRVPVGGLPVTVRGFLELIRPLFDEVTRNYLYSIVSSYNPNTERNMHCENPNLPASDIRRLDERRQLFAWGNLIRTDIESLFRRGVLNLPGNTGSLEFADRTQVGEWNRLERNERVNHWLQMHPFDRVNRLSFQMNDDHMRFHISGFALDRMRMAVALQEGNAPVEIEMNHVVADSFDLELPSLDDILANHWDLGEIMKHSQIHLHGLNVGSLRIQNPQFNVGVLFQNAYFNHFWTSVENVGSDQGLVFNQDYGEVATVDINAYDLGHVTTHNALIENFRYVQAPNNVNAQIGRISWNGDLAFAQDNVSVQMRGGSTLRNLGFDLSLQNNRIGNASIDFDVEGEASEGRIHLVPLNLDLRQLQIRNGHFHGTSFLRAGSDERNYTAALQGNLSVRFDSHFSSNLNIPGFNLEGDLNDVLLAGGADIRFNFGENYSWSVDHWSESEQGLSLEGDLRNALVTQDPSLADGELRALLNHEVVRTEARINTRLRIADVHHWASVPINPASASGVLARSANRLEMDMSGIQASGIEGNGEIWAALPLFGYMRAIMAMGPNAYLTRQNVRPAVRMPSTVRCSSLPSGTPSSISVGENHEPANYVYVGRWQGGRNGRANELSDLRGCIIGQPIDRSNSNPYLAVEIPRMDISNNRPFIDTHDTRLFIEAAWPDYQRGGWMYYSSEHRRPQLPSSFPAWARPGR